MSLPRFVAVAPNHQFDQAIVFDLRGYGIASDSSPTSKRIAVCFCHDIETADLVARALNREMMQ